MPFASLAGEKLAYLGTAGTYSRKCDTQVLLHYGTCVKLKGWRSEQIKVDLIKFKKSLML